MFVRVSCPTLLQQDGEAVELVALECRGEDAVSVHVSCSISLRQDGEAVALVALEGAPHGAARGAGDPTRRGAACVAWETAGTQHSAG